MPFKDPARRREYDRAWQRARGPRKGRGSRKTLEQLDETERCHWHFFTNNPCRFKARWVSVTGARYCDRHAEGKTGIARTDADQ